MLFAGAVARTNAAFGSGGGPVLLDEVMCTGLESRLFDCPHAGIEVEDCTHSDDAGVVCMEGIFSCVFFLAKFLANIRPSLKCRHLEVRTSGYLFLTGHFVLSQLS